MTPTTVADLAQVVSETIATRYYTYLHTMTQPLPDETTMTSKEEGYVDLIAGQMDSWTLFDMGSTPTPDPDCRTSEPCSAPGPTHTMLNRATIYAQFPDDSWDEMPLTGIGASSVAQLFWLYGATDTVPISATELDVRIDFGHACISVPDSVRESVCEGLEHFLSEDVDRTAHGRVQIIDGLVRSITLTLPSRPDHAPGDRIPESEMTLHLTPTPPRTLTFPFD